MAPTSHTHNVQSISPSDLLPSSTTVHSTYRLIVYYVQEYSVNESRVFDKIFSLHQTGSFQDIAEPI